MMLSEETCTFFLIKECMLAANIELLAKSLAF